VAEALVAYNLVMDAEVINVGTELLIGSTLNTHQQYLARACSALGVNLYRISTLGDNRSRLAQATTEALLRADLLIITGGLGPTDDDITLETTAHVLNLKLVTHQPTLIQIRKHLSTRRLPLTSAQSRQALVPEGCKVFPNPRGTAPGIFLQTKRMDRIKYVMLLPGPPRELNPMFDKHAKPYLTRILGGRTHAFITRSLIFPGLVEPHVASRVSNFLKAKPPLTLGIYSRPGEVELTIMSQAKTSVAALKAANGFEKKILKRFPRCVVLKPPETLSSRLYDRLTKAKMTLSVAESCTGGLLASMITETTGASRYFIAGLTAYHNRIKSMFLGISEGDLTTHGTVSEHTAREMATGARLQFNTDLAVSITGIAGPTGGTAAKPVGRVFIAIADEAGCQAWRYHFIGDRLNIQTKAARMALTLLVRKLSGLKPYIV